MNLSDADLNNLLKRHFGQDEFEPCQQEVIASLLSSKNVFAISYSGPDQSICYKLPAMVLDGLTLVVSRTSQTIENSSFLPATYINSSLPAEHLQNRIWDMLQGKYKLIYVGPEQFRNRSFLHALARLPASLLAIEDAHRISPWDHDFQLDYLAISKAVMEMERQPNILALAGPCTKRTQDDILYQLQIPDARRFYLDPSQARGHPARIEVRSAFSAAEKRDILKSVVQSSDSPGVIYASSRQQTVEICEFLKEFKPEVALYHGGIGQEKRLEIERAFIADRLRIVVTTAASSFGISISKPDIRCIIHFDMPDRLERYCQQISMAGADGQPAQCVLIYSPSDRDFHHRIIEKDSISSGELWRIKDILKKNEQDGLIVLPYGQMELEAGVDRYKLFRVLREMEMAGILTLLPDCSIKADARILVPRSKLTEYTEGEVGQSVIQWLLENSKTDPGEEIHIDFTHLKEELPHPHDLLENCLLALHYAKIILYKPSLRGMALRLVDLDASFTLDVFEKLKEHQYGSLQCMEDYVHTKECRWKFLNDYLGHETEGSCGKCDNCLAIDFETEPMSHYMTHYARVEDDVESIAHKKKTQIPTPQVLKQDKILLTILRCAEKTDGQVGRWGLVKILQGKKSKRLAKYGFDHIKEYGALSDMPKKLILEQIDVMIERGCLAVSSFFFPMLRLTELGKKRLEGMKTIR